MSFFRFKFGRKNAPAPAPEPAKPAEAPVEAKTPSVGRKVLGTKEAPVKKILAVEQCSIKAEDGVITLKGYANTKGQADRYGDVPTVFSQLRSYVYELGEFRKNPVMLIDHMNSVERIAGSYKVLKEDEVGLYFEAEFSKSNFPPIAHARQVYAEGHAKALSIAGRWYFEDKEHPERLTYAEIFEISLVGVGADPNALAAVEQPGGKALPAEPVAAPAPCCYRHTGNVQKDLPCATLAQVQQDEDLKNAIEAVLIRLEAPEQTAFKAEMEELVTKLEARCPVIP